MAKHEILIPSTLALAETAKQFIALMDDHTIFAFNGEMGAGKTTFIMALLEALGVDPEELAGSPSFALINEYRSDSTAELIYHFDLYRLESLEEAFEIGIEDYLDSGALCLIEWPDRIEDILPADTVEVSLTVNDNQTRTLTIATPD